MSAAPAPFFYLVQLFAVEGALDQVASDEVHYPAGHAEPHADAVAAQAAYFFTSDEHGIDEEEVIDGVIKVWGPFYMDPGTETVVKVAPSEDVSETGWSVVQ